MKQDLKQELKPRKSIKTKNKIFIGLLLLVLSLSVVLLYPLWLEYQSSEVQRLMKKGVRQESLGRAHDALETYRLVLSESPGEVEAAEALYRMARLWQFDLQDPQQALLKYLQLERDYSDTDKIRLAREAAARIVKFDLRDDMQSIGYYQRLINSQQGEQDNYLYEIADSYFRLENYPQARIELENLLSEYPHSPLTADALHRKATILVLENRLDEAQQDWQRLADEFPDSSYASRARFNLANLLEEKGELDLALEEYLKLENYPRPLLLDQKIDHLTRRIETRNEVTE